MKTAAIIAEYNPFHNGHKYQIEQLKSVYGYDRIIILMSGDFVQRGAPALISKYTRAKEAVCGGADLVLELPAAVSLGSAGVFAAGSVHLLQFLPADTLCFGCEEDDLALLRELAALFVEEPQEYRRLLQSRLSNGLSYPAARADAAGNYLHRQEEIHRILSGPNNTLAISYLEALIKQDSKVTPLAIQRKGSGYHDLQLSDLSSASAIRHALLKTGDAAETVSSAVPEDVMQDLSQSQLHPFRSLDDFTPMLRYALLSHNEDSLSSYIENEDLLRRLLHEGSYFTSITDLIASLKHKSVNYSAISRLLCRILLGIDRNQTDCACSNEAAFLRPLAMRKDAGDLIQAIREISPTPILMQLAKDEALLNPAQKAVLQTNLKSTKLCNIAEEGKIGHSIQNEYQMPLFFL